MRPVRGRPKGSKRIVEEDDEDEYLEADEQIADPDEGLLADEDDLPGDLEDEDDESEYGVRGGSRRKAKSAHKARGGAGRSSAPRGGPKRGTAARGSRSKSTSARGRRKAAADEDEEFINDGAADEDMN